MFRKLISNLSYSPSLIGEVAKLATRLKHEEKLRRIGLIALLIALICNLLALVNPPESSNTASGYDFLYGGVHSKSALLEAYSSNDAHFRDVVSTLGITKSELETSTPQTISTTHSKLYLVSRKPLGAPHNTHFVTSYKPQNRAESDLYLSPLRTLDTTKLSLASGSKHQAFTGQSAKAGRFAVLAASGAIAVEKSTTRTTFAEQSPLRLTQTAFNDTRRQPAHSTLAHASDRITYSLDAQNLTDEVHAVAFSLQVDDILEYADIVDARGGSLNLQEKTLRWPSQTVEPGNTSSQQFVVRLKTHLPATAHGTSNPHSYDCLITNTFGTTTQVALACPPAKLAETISAELPHLSVTVGIGASVATFLLALYLYLRTVQQKEEIRLIRRDVNEGVIG